MPPTREALTVRQKVGEGEKHHGMDNAMGWAYESVERVQDTVLAEMLLT